MPAAPTAVARFAALRDAEPVGEYNFEHFRFKHLADDLKRTATTAGVRPGEEAPDFELPAAAGGAVRLSHLRGRPVLLHFGSLS